ncbi:YjhX family toxin [Parasphingopyxis sp.]|uniref:YjhX family toxin n=1 Tax=Parasphingopyxis sp. TaxID=1920299 RepID=UPI00261719BE|nr:YjhX family toxin [Parasphingopyxis sp.]
MNISKYEQRTLHVLAQGGHIAHDHAPTMDGSRGRIVKITCFTREGHALSDCTMAVFKKLKKRRLIISRGGGPYRISRKGLDAVRPQCDNR